MLQFPQKRYKWVGRAQSGFYIDFIFKKFSDVFLRNVFMATAMFFGEKYMVEHLTKKTTDFFIFNTNRYIGLNNLNYTAFFYVSMSTVFYLCFFINVILYI